MGGGSEWSEVSLPDGWQLDVLEEAGSTNDELRARVDAQEGLVVLAERQLAGRGRRGAAWYSDDEGSLTFSLLLRPSEQKVLWPRLSLAAGLAVAEALGRFGIEAEIKWPNDVLVGGRKLCGILVDAAEDRVIVGIGLNVGTLVFPSALKDLATSMAVEGGRNFERAMVLSQVLASLSGWTKEIGSGFPDLIKRVRERCALSGRRVRLISADGLVEGVVLEIAESGEIVLDTNEGEQRFLQANEVRCL